jgi:hypothetical protein
MTRGFALLAVLLAACGGGAGQVGPVPEAEAGLRSFLQAAADSNFVAMSEHWGNERGSARETNNPADYQQRMVVIQAYLAGIRYRVLSNHPVANVNSKRVLQVELSRAGCVIMVPFTMARTSSTWVVNEFDLEKIGNPSRSCSTGAPSP